MSEEWMERVWLALFGFTVVLFAALVLVLVLVATVARAEGNSAWWQGLQRERPDGTRLSCCAEYDAVYADVWHSEGQEIVVTVTGRGPKNHDWAPVGRVYRLPARFLVNGAGNPTGHAILFLNPGSLEAICFIPGAGI